MDQKTSYKTLLIAFLIWFVISIIIVSITGFIYYSAIIVFILAVIANIISQFIIAGYFKNKK